MKQTLTVEQAESRSTSPIRFDSEGVDLTADVTVAAPTESSESSGAAEAAEAAESLAADGTNRSNRPDGANEIAANAESAEAPRASPEEEKEGEEREPVELSGRRRVAEVDAELAASASPEGELTVTAAGMQGFVPMQEASDSEKTVAATSEHIAAATAGHLVAAEQLPADIVELVDDIRTRYGSDGLRAFLEACRQGERPALASEPAGDGGENFFGLRRSVWR